MTPETQPGPEQPVFFGKGMIAIIAGIVIILVVLLAAGLMEAKNGTTVPPADCAEKTMAFINSNMVADGSSATLVSITESHGLYELKTVYESQEIVLHTTRDCTLLFTNYLDMTETAAASQGTSPAMEIPKTARPVVDLYVMSFCPYGTQAEEVMSPVYELLKAKADIRLRYITTITGTTSASVDSMHGAGEAEEDLRQACIARYYPDRFWEYLNTFNNECYPSWQNAGVLDSCRENTTAALSIDSAKIDACAAGSEGFDLIRADDAAATKVSAYSSPSLFINGVKYSGARTPEGYKQAICNGFETVPEECSTVLSSATAASSGGCG